MKSEMFGAIALLLAGAAFIAVVAWRLMSGKSYITNPAMAVSRGHDPFSFWLSLLFPAGFGVALIIGGCVMLWGALHPS
jgi:hypothetical protein